MPTDLHDALIRLRCDELPAAEAASLRRRIALEPEVAAACARVDAALGGLESLPELPPPAALQQQVLTRLGTPARQPWLWITTVASTALAAGLAAALLWPQAPPTHIMLLSGTELVEGRAEVTACGSQVTVDGLARIFCEPLAPALRDASPEVDPMNSRTVRTLLAGGAAGAALTVTVYEGFAAVSAGDGPAVVLEAETQRRFAPQTAASHPSEPPSTPSGGPAATALEEQLRSLRIENQVLRGQLAMHGGEEVPWPDAPTWSPDGVDALMAAAFPDTDVELECSEFPCIATFALATDIEIGPDGPDPSDSPALTALAMEAGGRMSEQFQLDNNGDKPQFFAYHQTDDDGVLTVHLVWYPPDLAAQITPRIEPRMSELMER